MKFVTWAGTSKLKEGLRFSTMKTTIKNIKNSTNEVVNPFTLALRGSFAVATNIFGDIIIVGAVADVAVE